MSDLPFKRLTIFGLGLIGGSLAMAARERFSDWQIQGVDPQAETLQYALRSQIIDKAALNLEEAAAWFESASSADEPQLIVLAAHLDQNLSLLTQLAPLVKDRPFLVTDIGSCKRQIMELGQALLPVEFIAGHPMAGREFSGIEGATPLMFAGKSYLLCPHSDTDSQRLAWLQDFVRGLGGNPRLIDAERHDRYMAYVSHLPQLYAVMLTNLLYRHEAGHLLAYHGGGLDDQLRLAASPHRMWGQVFAQNQDNMVAVLTELRQIIDEVLPLLGGEAATQGESLQQWFERSNEVHRQFQAIRASRAGLPLS